MRLEWKPFFEQTAQFAVQEQRRWLNAPQVGCSFIGFEVIALLHLCARAHGGQQSTVSVGILTRRTRRSGGRLASAEQQAQN